MSVKSTTDLNNIKINFYSSYFQSKINIVIMQINNY